MSFSVDSNFPGGNIVVERVEDHAVYVHQDLRDTETWWFYWYFRVHSAAGKTLTFRFTNGDVIGTRGPAVSVNGGLSWQWLSPGRRWPSTEEAGLPEFTYTFPPEADEVRFCFAVPYLQSHLDTFLAKYRGHLHLRPGVLCTTRQGRAVERLHLGCIDHAPQHRVLLTSRHHACESLATYTLEGLMDEVLAGGQAGAWLREHVEFFIVPFMDKDGVENGDQGKNRQPHDHNRDYGFAGSAPSESTYASTRALRQHIPTWSEGKLHVALDLHCPWIRGEQHEVIHFVGGPDQANWAEVQKFSRILEAQQSGPLVYRATDNLPFGVAWNTAQNVSQGRSFGKWAASLPGVYMGTSLEIPYANVREQDVTAGTARALGCDLARALYVYLRVRRE